MKALDLFSLLKRSDSSNALQDATILNLIEYCFHIPKAKVFSNSDVSPNTKELDRVVYLLRERVPFAYITGRESFYGREFFITPGVFIPRNETEILVEEALKAPFEKVLDYGSGSGAICVTLLLENDKSTATAVEISHVGCLCTYSNAEKFNVSNRLTLLTSLPDKGIFDLIVSNPPYVDFKSLQNVDESVKLFEPMQAVFHDNPTRVYNDLLIYGKEHLSKHGRIVFEIDDDLTPQIVNLALSLGFDCSLTRDFSNLNRIAVITPRSFT
jgi:release factor glutamine methyltransferase